MKIAKPEKHGLDSSRLGAIDRLLKERYLDPGHFPHAQLLIARDGEVVHFSSQGAAREGKKKAIDESALFRIASMTKPCAEPMRMVDLLRHTAGFTYSFQNRSNIDAAHRALKLENWHGDYDLDSFIAALGKLPLEFSPGTRWNYSVATDVLGLVVQRVSGMKLERFFAERIFAPLGMNDTFFTVPTDKLDRLVDCYTVIEGKGRQMFDRASESMWATPFKFVSGGGGLVSSAHDYNRFCQMCLGGGELDGARIVGRKTIELMTMNHLPGNADLSSMSTSLFSETQNAGTGFGLGFAVTIDVARSMMPGSVGEYYWGGMFSTAFFIDPVERLSMVFMTQLSPSMLYPIRRELKTMIYSALT